MFNRLGKVGLGRLRFNFMSYGVRTRRIKVKTRKIGKHSTSDAEIKSDKKLEKKNNH